MRCLITIMLLSAIMLTSGCVRESATDTSPPVDSGYSNSAPAKMLEAPDKARDAAEAANERTLEAQKALEN